MGGIPQECDPFFVVIPVTDRQAAQSDLCGIFLEKKSNNMSLQAWIKSPNATLVDVREAWELAGGQVEGAKNIPLGEIPNRIEEFREMSKPIILFCRSGNRSGMARAILQAQGISDVHNGGSWEEVAQAQAEVISTK